MSKLKEFAEFVLEVEKNGGSFQFDCGKGWNNVSIDNERHALNFKYWLYGITRLKPKEEKKKIPLEFSDITPNTVFSYYPDKCGWFKTYSANKDGVETPVQDKNGGLTNHSYEDLMKTECYYSEDGKTWKGCYKYEN